MDYEQASYFNLDNKNVGMDMINMFNQMVALSEQNEQLMEKANSMQAQVAENMKAIKEMQTNLKRQISRMTNEDLKRQGIEDRVSFRNGTSQIETSLSARVNQFQKQDISRLNQKETERALSEQKELEEKLDDKLRLQRHEDEILENQRLNEVRGVNDRLVSVRMGTIPAISVERGRVGTFTNERIKSMRSRIDLLTGKASVLMNQIELQGKRVNYGLNGAYGKDEQFTVNLSNRLKEKYELLVERLREVQRARLAARKEEERLREEQRIAEGKEDEIAEEANKKAEEALAAQKEEEKVEKPNFRPNTAQVTNSGKSKCKNTPREVIINGLASIGNWDLKFKNALLQGKVGFEELKESLANLYEKGNSKRKHFTQELLNKYRELKDKRDFQKGERLAEKQERQQEKMEAREAREAEKQAEIEEKERIAQRKADFIEALRAQRREQRAERIANFKAGVAQKVASAKAMVSNFKNKIVEGYKEFRDKRDYERGMLLDEHRELQQQKMEEKMAREAEKQAEIEEKERIAQRKADFIAALKDQAREQRAEKIANFKAGVAQKVDSAKAKAAEVKNQIIEDYREFKDQRDFEKGERLAEKQEREQQKMQEQAIREAEKQAEIEEKERIAQRKADFIEALRAQRREQRAEKIANFKAGVAQKVDSAKAKAAEVRGRIAEDYREFKDQRDYERGMLLDEQRELQQQKMEEKMAREAEKMQAREEKERVAQRKADFIASLKAQAREQRQEKITNFKAGVSQKVSSAKQKIGTFGSNAVNKMKETGVAFTEKTKEVLSKLAGAVKRGAYTIASGIEDGVASVKELMEELENDTELKRMANRENLLAEYEQLVARAQQYQDEEFAYEGGGISL